MLPQQAQAMAHAKFWQHKICCKCLKYKEVLHTRLKGDQPIPAQLLGLGCWYVPNDADLFQLEYGPTVLTRARRNSTPEAFNLVFCSNKELNLISPQLGVCPVLICRFYPNRPFLRTGCAQGSPLTPSSPPPLG